MGLTWHHTWHQNDAINLAPYVDEIHRQLEAAAEAGGDEARALAGRLAAPLDAAFRLALQDVLAAAVEEITVELAPGSVELRLRGREPEFVITPPPADPTQAGEEDTASSTWPVAPDGEEGSVSRINLRLPEHLKARIERAAADEGMSVNSWLVRASAAAVERTGDFRRRERRAPHGAQRYTGWAR
jgi:HicB family